MDVKTLKVNDVLNVRMNYNHEEWDTVQYRYLGETETGEHELLTLKFYRKSPSFNGKIKTNGEPFSVSPNWFTNPKRIIKKN